MVSGTSRPSKSSKQRLTPSDYAALSSGAGVSNLIGSLQTDTIHWAGVLLGLISAIAGMLLPRFLGIAWELPRTLRQMVVPALFFSVIYILLASSYLGVPPLEAGIWGAVGGGGYLIVYRVACRFF